MVSFLVFGGFLSSILEKKGVKGGELQLPGRGRCFVCVPRSRVQYSLTVTLSLPYFDACRLPCLQQLLRAVGSFVFLRSSVPSDLPPVPSDPDGRLSVASFIHPSIVVVVSSLWL